jgi:hypothetical protein
LKWFIVNIKPTYLPHRELDCDVEWIEEPISVKYNRIYFCALVVGQLEIMKWICEIAVSDNIYDYYNPRNPHTFLKAAEYGYLDVMKFANACGFVWDDTWVCVGRHDSVDGCEKRTHGYIEMDTRRRVTELRKNDCTTTTA